VKLICCRDKNVAPQFTKNTDVSAHTNIQGVSGGVVNILGGGSMDYSV